MQYVYRISNIYIYIICMLLICIVIYRLLYCIYIDNNDVNISIFLYLLVPWYLPVL